MRWNRFLCATTVLVAMGSVASATPISGTFNMSGTVTVTATTMTWNSDVSPFAPGMFTLSSGAGSFAGADGQNAIDALNISTEPVGAAFAPAAFISFDVGPALPGLEVDFISAGIGGSAACSLAPAVGQTCTPPNPGGSPFTFTNESLGQSGAQWVVSGVTSDGLSAWTGVFSSQFNEPFQTVLSAFAMGGSGSVSNSFAATLTVTVTPTPEPFPFVTLAFGLVVLVACRKYRQAL